MSRKRIVGAAVVAVVFVLGAAAWKTVSVPVPNLNDYTGFEKKIPRSYPTPKIKPGFKFTIGYLNPLAGNETLAVLQRGMEAEAKHLGGKVISKDANLSVDKQASQFNDLLAAKVDAIVVFPLDARALNPSLAAAKKAGIPVFGQDVTFSPGKAPPGFTSQVWQGRDAQAWEQATMMAAAAPHGKIAYITIGVPVPSIHYWDGRLEYWLKKLGMTVLGKAENPTDDPTGGEKAATSLIGRFPTIDGIICYNDYSCNGAYAALRAASRKANLIGLAGTPDGFASVRNGRFIGTIQLSEVELGKQSVISAYDYLTKQGLPLPKVVVAPAVPVVKANVNNVPSWDKQIAAIAKG
jgi:ribose transport system substrate-binding protein